MTSYPQEVKKSLLWMTENAKDKLLAELAAPEVQDEWIEAYRHRLKRKEKDAVRLYPELLKMIGAENSVNVMLGQRFGYSSLDELELAVGRYKEAAALTDEQRFERCMQFAVQYLKTNPYEREAAVLRLKNASRAELVPEVDERSTPSGTSGDVSRET